MQTTQCEGQRSTLRGDRVPPLPNLSATSHTGISVIIPTFKRVDLCQKLFQSLEQSRHHAPLPVEVLAIDNSPPIEAEQIQALCLEYGARYVASTLGVGAKRNLGATLAQHSLILFIDSDCEVSPECLREHIKFYVHNPQTVAVLGKTSFKGPQTFVWKAIQWTPFVVPFTLADQVGSRVWGPSNNLSFRKDVFLSIQGFDESFPQKPGGEDVDLGYRLYQNGHLITANPRAQVYHTTETWNTFNQITKRLFQWGKAEFFLYYHHPDYLYYDCPKGLGLLLLIGLASLLTFIITTNQTWLWTPPIFLVINYLTRILLNLYYNPRRAQQIHRVAVAELFNLVYEAGLVVQCLRQRWFDPLYHRIFVSPDEARQLWNMQVFYTWMTVLQLALTLAFAHILNLQ